MIVDRRRVVQFEVVAVLAYAILPAWAAHVVPASRSGAHPRVNVGADLAAVLSSAGQIGLLLFVMWNSGDRWSEFRLGRPRIKEVLDGMFGGAIAYGTCVIPRFSMRGTAPALRTPRTGLLHFALSQTHWLLWLAFGVLAFQSIVLSRLLWLGVPTWFAVFLTSVAYGLYLSSRYGWAGLGTGIVIGMVSGGVFVWGKNVWSVLAMQASFFILEEFYG